MFNMCNRKQVVAFSACRWSEWDNPDNCSQTDLSTSFTDCNDVYNAGNRQDGVYCIRPTTWNKPPFKVYCNMSVDGGSWTVSLIINVYSLVQ